MTERLSSNFFVREFTRSETAARKGIEIVPTSAELENLKRLAVDVLEPIRRICDDRSITIWSGLRPMWLNKEVKGSKNSDHINGRAADIIVAGLSPLEVCRRIAKRMHDLPIKQLILEYGRWTHVSVSPANEVPRRQILTYYYDAEQKSVCTAGIVDTTIRRAA